MKQYNLLPKKGKDATCAALVSVLDVHEARGAVAAGDAIAAIVAAAAATAAVALTALAAERRGAILAVGAHATDCDAAAAAAARVARVAAGPTRAGRKCHPGDPSELGREVSLPATARVRAGAAVGAVRATVAARAAAIAGSAAAAAAVGARTVDDGRGGAAAGAEERAEARGTARRVADDGVAGVQQRALAAAAHGHQDHLPRGDGEGATGDQARAAAGLVSVRAAAATTDCDDADRGDVRGHCEAIRRRERPEGGSDALAGDAIRARAVRGERAGLAEGALGRAGAAAVRVALGAVLDSIGAGRRLAGVVRAAVAVAAVRRRGTHLPVRALAAGAAAVHIGLGAVLRAVGAAWHLAAAADAHAGGALAAVAAILAVTAGAAGAAAVHVDLRAVLDPVGAPRRPAGSVLADAGDAVAGHRARAALAAGDADAAAVDVDLGAVLDAVHAGGRGELRLRRAGREPCEQHEGQAFLVDISSHQIISSVHELRRAWDPDLTATPRASARMWRDRAGHAPQGSARSEASRQPVQGAVHLACPVLLHKSFWFFKTLKTNLKKTF